MATALVPYLASPTPEESHQALIDNSSEWKGALSTEAYFRREAHLADQDLTRNSGLRGWILAQDSDTPGQPRQLLCACETLQKRGLVATPGAKVRDVTCYGLASVYCPAQNRGKGYPTVMLKQVGQWLDGEGKSVFSVLYSDIGKKFYDRLGWRPCESSHLSLHPDAGGKVPDGVQLLRAEHLEDLCSMDERIVRQRLERLASEGKNGVAILSDARTIRWQQARESFVSKELWGKVPDVHGAMVKTPSGTTVWCLWTRWWSTTDVSNPKDNIMHILRLAVEDPNYDDTAATPEGVQKASGSEITQAIAALFQTARVEASKWTMAEVELWNPSSASVAAARQLEPNAEITHREKSSIASLRVSDPELAKVANSLVWTCNEKFAWC